MKVRAVCTSEKRGIAKTEVEQAHLIKNFGIEGDAHAGAWHRQVSLLSASAVDEFNKRGAGVGAGDFGENIIVEGIDCAALPIGSVLTIGDEKTGAALRLTQRGKECHTHCEIHKRMGECIMPYKGVFAEVIRGGIIRPGDRITVKEPDPDRPFQAAVIVTSDKGASGEREDTSGPKACELLKAAGYDVIECVLIPDDKAKLRSELIRLADKREADLIITSGGTGFAARDITPEVTMEVADKTAPGIAEYIRYRSFDITAQAMLSRAVSVIRKKTLIINLPGSPKAVEECLGFILGPVEHGLLILRGSVSECATIREEKT